MKKIGRFWVALFGLILWQSSLGTKAAQINAQNLGQNGYRKYEDGFMILCGRFYYSNSSSNTYTLPMSFFDTNYICAGMVNKSSINNSASVLGVYVKNRSTIQVVMSYAQDGGNGYSSGYFDLIAVGRWK